MGRHHLKKQNADMLLVCSEWFLTWFARSCPVRTVLRIWDKLFTEGHTILFKAAIGVFHHVGKDLLHCSSLGEIMKNAKVAAQRLMEHEAFPTKRLYYLTLI